MLLERTYVILFGDGNQVIVSTGEKPVRFLLVSGPRYANLWRGPIVMNTKEELNIAFRGHREGTFIKRK